MTAQIADTSSQNEYLDILDEAWRQHLAPRAEDAPTVVSTFAGCGGSSLGYSMAGYKELLAVEWDDNAVETFKLNFPDVPIYHGDIATLSVEECLELAGIEPGELDILDGSPPCQGFSTAGKRNMDDDRNQLFREYVRLLHGLQPKVFVMENVSGMVKGKMKLIFAEVMRELKASGYIVKCQLMNAMYFNVPQSRQRLIFIGVRDDLDIIPNHPKAERKPFTVEEAFVNVVHGKYAPVYNGDSVVFPYIQQGKAAKESVPNNVLLQYIPRMVNNTTFSFNGILRRLDNERCAWTLTKQYIKYAETPIAPEEDRIISSGEAQRLHSYSDEFCFVSNYKHRIARIGNSVPPLFMRSIARHIREQILTPERISHA